MFEKHHEHQLAEQRALLETFLAAARDDHAPAGVSPVALHAGEQLVYALPGAHLIEARRGPGHWVGRSQGVSVHVPGTKSMRYRVGASHGTFVQGDEQPAPVDSGTFTITTTRAVFVGAMHTVEWDWSKLVAITHDEHAPVTMIAVSNRQKTSGVLYDRHHEDDVRFRLDLALARNTNTTAALVAHLEAELAALQPATPTPTMSEGTPSHGTPSEGTPSDAWSTPAQRVATAAYKPGVVEQPTPAPPAPPAAWYPDPTGRFDYRWWDGTRWSDHVARNGVPDTDPLA